METTLSIFILVRPEGLCTAEYDPHMCSRIGPSPEMYSLGFKPYGKKSQITQIKPT